jgi:AcrR family transcriptional regulator
MTTSELPARGRPRSFDEAATIDAALDVFWRDGYARASVPAISEATSLSTSSLYNAYGSKLDLYVAALDRYLDVVVDGSMVGPLARGDAGVADVEAFLSRLGKTTRPAPPRGCLIVNTIGEFRDPPDAVAERTARYRKELRAGLRAALRRAEQIGEIPAGTAHERADAIVPIVVAFNLLVAAHAPERETRELLRTARRIAAG